MSPPRTYLGVPLEKPRAAFFDLTSCEGCQLQILNNEATLLDFLSLVEIVTFREAMTGESDVYQIAFVEGSITRADEVEKIRSIRTRAGMLVALGSCAAFGGVNQLKNRFSDPDWVKKTVYGEGEKHIESGPARPLSAVVKVDLTIPGCPIRKEEVERAVVNLVMGRPVVLPKYPVCMDCKAIENVCLFDLGEPCMGPITKAGCDAWCPSNRAGCWGCRGPSDDANVEEWRRIMRRHGFSHEAAMDRLSCFGGFFPFSDHPLEKSAVKYALKSADKTGAKKTGRRAG